jgi:hypothetical protein
MFDSQLRNDKGKGGRGLSIKNGSISSKDGVQSERIECHMFGGKSGIEAVAEHQKVPNEHSENYWST